MSDPLTTRLAAALGSSYEVTSLLGRGGMGAVYRATDRRLRREVAIKVLPPELGYSEELRVRFVREAQMVAQLSHPNIVPIYDVGECDELVWFVMAFIDGESVRAKVEREGPQPVSLVRRVLQEVAQALAYAHAKGVIHRDIKPDNILLDHGSGRALVTDFGIAKALSGGETELTQPGEVVGTARYMAPEQALAEGTADARVDQYALGLVGYYLLAGQHAIKGVSLPAVIAEHVKGPTIDLTRTDRRLPAPLVHAVTRCLAPTPEGRFARMEEFADALRELGGDLPDVPAPVRKVLRETERMFYLGATAALAVGAIGVERVPLGLALFFGASAISSWVAALEQASRSGVTWSAIRRAVYVERARRVEEVAAGEAVTFGPAGTLATAGLVIAVLLVGDVRFGAGSVANIALLGAGAALLAAGAKIFRLPGQAPGKIRMRVVFVAIAFLVAAVAFLALQEPRGRGGPVLAVSATLVAVGLLAAAAFLIYRSVRGVRRLMTRLAVALDAPVPWLRSGDPPNPVEWRLPRWVDVMGSWLFGRFRRDGWRIRFERDQPAAMETAQVNLSSAARAERRIRDLAARVGASAAAGAAEARRLAAGLLSQCRRTDQELKPLLAKVARLSEGVLVSRTIAAGGSLESELDQAERDADRLRAHARECGDMLQALSAGLEGVVQGQDTLRLDAALERARQLSTGVRRAILQAEVT
jgi:hypothetical protein